MSKIYKAALILLNYQTSKIINGEKYRRGDHNDFIGSSVELDTSHLVAKDSIRTLKVLF